ncbi:MAG: hypothetical protein MR998_09680, partial [Lachnospiraceae bacterium]|nr:hypothetical protein [Lachnospiraceae bacterium]
HDAKITLFYETTKYFSLKLTKELTFCLFFATLPFANNCLDYLVRTNIPDELQGRAWGVIGFLSQIGYVVAYGLAGVAADGIASKLQIGVGRGAAGVVMTAGVLLSLTALSLYPIKSIRALERKSS